MTAIKQDAIVFVDGENISSLDIAYVNGLFTSQPKFIYQTDRACRKRGYPGYVHVIPPRIGKETVDKIIAMDVVDAYHTKACRAVVLVSNDRDFGATAIHLKSRYPDLDITILCDPAKISASYAQHVARADIHMRFLEGEDQALDEFACQVIEVIRELYLQDRLDLPALGAMLRERGVEYKKLKRDLIQHGVIEPGGNFNVVLTAPAMRALPPKRHRCEP